MQDGELRVSSAGLRRKGTRTLWHALPPAFNTIKWFGLRGLAVLLALLALPCWPRRRYRPGVRRGQISDTWNGQVRPETEDHAIEYFQNHSDNPHFLKHETLALHYY